MKITAAPTRLRWTVSAIALLAVLTLLLWLWLDTDAFLTRSHHLNSLPWGWWRGAAYTSLLLIWPRLVAALTGRGRVQVPRRPLLLVILLYEILLVRNPLALLLHGWS